MDDVLIIGGGFAGLAAGVALAKAGRRVRLFEQKPHLGGRARSFTDPVTGSAVDNGQHLFMGCYHNTRRFLAEIGTLDCVRFQPRLKLYFLDAPGQGSTFECLTLPAPWHLFGGVFSSRSFTWSEKLQIFRLGRELWASRVVSLLAEQDRTTVEQWLIQRGQSERLRRIFWDLISVATLNEDPRLASGFLFERVLRLALFTSPADSTLGIARMGLSACYTDAAKSYIESRGGRVELGRKVVALLAKDGVCEGVKLVDGESIAVRTVVSAVPWTHLPPLLGDNLLKTELYFGAIPTLRPAPIISLSLWFDRPVVQLEFAALCGTAFQWLFNRSRILGSSDNCVSLVLSGAHAHIDWTKDDLTVLALRELDELLPAMREAKLIHSLLIKERFATFSPTWDAEQVRPSAISPIRGFYLAGDWTATGLPATIEGAVKSGFTVAEAILHG